MAKTVELTRILLVCSTDLDQSQASRRVLLWSPVWNPEELVHRYIGLSFGFGAVGTFCCLSVHMH